MRPIVFAPPESFRPAGSPYRFLPFRFLRWSEDEVLLVNDVGESLFLPSDRFAAFAGKRLHPGEPAYMDLQAKHFLWDGPSTVPIDLLATKYRTKKSFLDGFTKLHMFVVTLRCDHSCRYCQVSRVSLDRARYDMTPETARKAVDLMFCCPSPALKVEFQGGEPLLNFDLVRSIIERVEERNRAEGRAIEFVVTTNLVPLTDEILSYLKDHDVCLSTSLDGPEFLHNANRPRPGNDSYAIVVRQLERARRVLGEDRVSAIMTTTRRSLDFPCEIVDEYVRQGFSSIFLRPISPYGHAVRTGEAMRYQMDQFLDFYRTAFERIIALNRQGSHLTEVYAQILLTRMLTPFSTGYVDLQSPAGAGLGAVAYDYDGDVYASDEARMLAQMGDDSFRLGNVHSHSYREIFGGEVLQALAGGSILESLPGCAECAFLPYCGADPVFHHRTQGDIVGHRPTSAFCAKNMALLKYLFTWWRSGDEFLQNLFLRWASDARPPAAEEGHVDPPADVR